MRCRSQREDRRYAFLGLKRTNSGGLIARSSLNFGGASRQHLVLVRDFLKNIVHIQGPPRPRPFQKFVPLDLFFLENEFPSPH